MSNSGRTSSADTQLARGVVVAFLLASAVALLGPLISYRSDVEQVRSMLKDRIAQLARAYAEALGRHLAVTQAELVLISGREEMDPARFPDPEPLLKDFTHYHSALFETGLLLVDANGHRLWSAPPEILKTGTDFGREAWFQELLHSQQPVAEVLESGTHQILVAAPVVRGAQLRGAVVGLVDASRSTLPGAPAVGEGTSIIIVDPAGDLLMPNPPAWAHGERFRREVESLVMLGAGADLELGPTPQIAAASVVPGTNLRLLLSADEEPLIAPMRRRFLLQLIIVASVQTAAVLLLSLFLRQMYRRTLEAERRSVDAEKLAALGAASSLIAHEVKNSLNGLNAAASLLGGGPPEQALPVKTLRGQIDRLKHLATSLLHFGKPASAKRVRTDLAALVRESVKGLRVLPEAEEVSVEIRGDPSLEAECDPLLLATALDNLVRNAIEAAVAAKDLGHNPSPRVTVILRHDPGAARIDVEDNAGGPPADFTPFQPFVTTKSKGIGLGLSMAKRAMEAQDGTLDFARTAEGSRFTLGLPLS